MKATENWKIIEPVYLVGHARGGSTALASAIHWAAELGPRQGPIATSNSYQTFLESIKRHEFHYDYSSQLEQKDIWFRHLPGSDVFTHMGSELYYASETLSLENKKKLVKELTQELPKGLRFFSKAPSNTFRLELLKEISEKPKFVAVVRRGEEVISSWGGRHYGFGKPVHWGDFKRKRFSEKEAISIFHRKWLETIKFIEEFRRGNSILIVDYATLLKQPAFAISEIYKHCQLTLSDEVKNSAFEAPRKDWRQAIKKKYHKRVSELCKDGNEWIRVNCIQSQSEHHER